MLCPGNTFVKQSQIAVKQTCPDIKYLCTGKREVIRHFLKAKVLQADGRIKQSLQLTTRPVACVSLFRLQWLQKSEARNWPALTGAAAVRQVRFSKPLQFFSM
jgi:hypothetical protein